MNKDDIRQRTYDDMLEKLTSYKKCAVLRPTGFGKTWMLIRLIQSGLYSRILYLYPAKVIRNTIVDKYFDDMLSDMTSTDEETDESILDEETIELVAEIAELKEEGKIDGLTMMTYNKLSRMRKDDFKKDEYDLIIVDECHRIGGPRTKIAMSKLINSNENAALVGATATPNRMDAFDVVHTFFNDICTFEYNLHDAFKDKLLQVPNYCYCTTDAEEDLKTEAIKICEDLKDETVMDVIKKKAIEIGNLFNMENIIRTTCDEYAVDTDYMKFIVFFGDFNHIGTKLPEVNGWFQSAYPSHKVNNLIITSQEAQYAKNVAKLETLVAKPKTIDLICCIDMLNMGYHVNDLTGILMYRGTSSDIIFIQQLGRVFSSGNKNSSIVFDVVDNLHRKAVCDLTEHETVVTESKKKNTTVSVGWHMNKDGIIVDSDGDKAPVNYKDGKIFDIHGNETDFVMDVNGNITDREDYITPEIKANCNRMTREDFNMTGHIATYKELIAKAVCEPMSIRCRQVIELHFKKWCRVNGIPYPITEEELKNLSSLTKEDFRKEFYDIIRNNNLDYPIGDAKKLLSLGQQDGVVPLRIFARWKNVRISEILKLLGLCDEDEAV